MSILPTTYIFNTQKVLTPDRANFGLRNDYPLWLILIIVGIITAIMAVIFFCLMAHYASDNYHDDDNKHKRMYLVNGTASGIFSIIALIAFLTALFGNTTYGSQKPTYNLNCDFKLRNNSNLIVRQDRNDHPITRKDHHAYPYRLYVRNTANTNQLIYLGQTNTQKEIFLDDSSKTSKLFASYCNYIQKHHLANKFKQKLYFTRDNSVIDANGISQYVLKGDGITLKIKPKEHNKYHIYAVNE